MKALRRLAYLALVLAYAQIVFGAIVRISGSGMGCGNNWPQCFGAWLPQLENPTVAIEFTHRAFAVVVSVAVALVVLVALAKRWTPGVWGRGGVLRAALLSAALIVLQALLGMVTVMVGNTAWATVLHLANGALLLAALATTVLRAGGLGGEFALGATYARTRTARGAAAAAAIALCTVLFGGLTAKIPGANSACQGFPLCSGTLLPAIPAQHVQFMHRVLAFLLFLHVFGLMLGFARRMEAPTVLRTVRIAFGLICLQLVIAAAMVELHLPPALRSLHEADGIAIWVALFSLAWLARFPKAGRVAEVEREVDPVTAARLAAHATGEAIL